MRARIVAALVGVYLTLTPVVARPLVTRAAPLTRQQTSATVLRTIPVGTNPSLLAVDVRAERVYVVNGDASVTILNARSGGVLNTIPLMTATGSSKYLTFGLITVDEATGRVFLVGNDGPPESGHGLVAVLDASTGALIATRRLGTGAGSAVVDQQAGRVFVSGGAGSSGADLFVLDATTGAIDKTVLLPSGGMLAVDTRARHVFVVAGQGLVMLDARTGNVLLNDQSVGVSSNGVAALMVDERNARLLAVRAGAVELSTQSPRALVAGSDQVLVVDTRTGHAVANRAVTTSGQGAVVNVIDAGSGRPVRTVPLAGAQPVLMARDAQRMRVFALAAGGPNGNGGSLPGTVTILDARSGAPLGSFTVGVTPVAIAVDAATHLGFVLNQTDKSVSVFDTMAGTGALLRTVPMRGDPRTAVVDEAGAHVYITNHKQSTITVLSAQTGSLQRIIHVGQNPIGAALDTRSGRLFVANYTARTASVIALTSGTVQRTVPVGKNPLVIAVDERAGHAFVVNSNGRSVTMLDATTGAVRRTTPVGTAAIAATTDERTSRLFVANRDDNTVSVLSTLTGRLITTVPVGSAPSAIVADQTIGRVFVANTVSHTISMLDARNGQVLSTLPLASSPSALADDTSSGRIFVVIAAPGTTAIPQNDSISILDARTGAVVGGGPLGFGPHVITIDGRAGRAVVTNQLDDTVSIFDVRSGSALGTVAVGLSPVAAAADSHRHRVFIVNEGDNTVSVLDARRSS